MQDHIAAFNAEAKIIEKQINLAFCRAKITEVFFVFMYWTKNLISQRNGFRWKVNLTHTNFPDQWRMINQKILPLINSVAVHQFILITSMII